VVPYLTLAAFRATLDAIAKLPTGSAVSFDYALAPETLSAVGRVAFKALAGRVAAAGEPFQLFFIPETMEAELRRTGFRRIEQVNSAQLNEIYFKGRADGLKLSAVGLGMLATAWV
jgi:O-methyltransferase involved in polyketide biosynthesis